ncbi:MAG: exodeoxyribonuclease V subunit gamma [Clostridium sp.]|nr:exodeoxyribonuclease V subunit gamma [Acetatifactor muris]MCM1527895.1 exodeoxyribonuclease V subunit gamma [Bacteroides sp.]MCM1563937.1 exodeoxyribonuclease V subunit gamma [Clostridium sp.]
MGLRFYFGPSGAGKSRQLYEEILTRAVEHPRQNFLVIVPDQFTMQTQKELATLSDRGGILNIDVLSFGRLGHRVLEEVGRADVPVLDDTGKSLVLQRVAAGIREELPVLGGFLNRQGYIHEVKSAISEFMQYGIGVKDMDRLIGFAAGRGALAQKLKDLQVLYGSFVEYIQGNFITTEEKLDVLARSLERSRLIPGSVVIFDGFTGFTPIQNRLIGELMRLCGEVIVTMTLGEGENPYVPDGEQRLFHLTKKTVADLERLAGSVGAKRESDVFLARTGEDGTAKRFGREIRVIVNSRDRFAEAPALAHLERNLFRYPYKTYEEIGREIRLFETGSPREEVRQVGLEICRLIREEGLAYRDIAIVIGDLEGYAPYVESEFERMGIPCFLDRTRGIVLNPMIEYIKSALELFEKDFSYRAVFHYLRSGLADMEPEEVDRLENYCIRTGIHGYRQWSRLFTRRVEQAGEGEGPLAELNALRQRLMDQVEMLHMSGEASAAEYVDRLYEFLVANRVQQKLVEYERRFREEQDPARAGEYAQIYRLVMELLEQVHELLGEERVTLTEFREILESGFQEIEVGILPQNVDRVTVGDMERTRLKQVETLFFMGVNDGNIPKNVSKGGIISDLDREFLRESDLELAPSPRQQMYIQRLYLYLNMTKPSGRLYLSYARVNGAGKSIRPAYLIETVQNLFPGLSVERPQNRPLAEQIVNPAQGRAFLADRLRDYAEGSLREEQLEEFWTIYQVYGEEAVCRDRDRLTEAAFVRYRDSGLSRLVARLLYGRNLQNSVSRLETFAACAYRHFLQYGLSLREREEFGFEKVDMGNVYHAVLESFGGKLAESGYTWFDFPREFGERAVREALEAYAAVYGDTVLYSSARNEYAITRMGRILTRTVLTLQHQLKKGSFEPSEYELSFKFAGDLESIRVTLSEDERMHLQGRIDRIDTAQDGEHVYVKVIDYKSGSRHFDLVALYYGLQLQLVVYMNAAMELEAQRHPDKEIVPAAMLYYHIDDPVVETAQELSEEELNARITENLRMNGVVNADPSIVDRLDRGWREGSDVIPVECKKDGGYTARSGVMKEEELRAVSDYVGVKIRDIGRQMLEGCISVNPYEKGTEDACAYCAYKKVCGFDNAIPGYDRRRLEDMDRETVLKQMNAALAAE